MHGICVMHFDRKYSVGEINKYARSVNYILKELFLMQQMQTLWPGVEAVNILY